MREGQPQPKEERPKPSAVKKWAQRIALGTALAGGGYGVGYERGKTEIVQPEKEHIENDAEELTGKLEDMIDLIDELNRGGLIVNKYQKQTELLTDYKVIFSHALGMTPDFGPDASAQVTWQKSKKADQVYELINKIIERDSFLIQTGAKHDILHTRAAELKQGSTPDKQQ